MEIKDKVFEITTKTNANGIPYDYTFTNTILKSLTRKEFSILLVNQIDDPYFSTKICLNNIYDQHQFSDVAYGSTYAENVSIQKKYNLIGYFEDKDTRIFLTTCSSIKEDKVNKTTISHNRLITVFTKASKTYEYYWYNTVSEDVPASEITYMQYVNNSIYLIPNDLSYSISYIPLIKESAKISSPEASDFKIYDVVRNVITHKDLSGSITAGGILYKENIYVFPNNSKVKPFKINCTDNKTYDVPITYNKSFDSVDISYISQIGEANDFGFKGQLCFLKVNKTLHTLDMEDLELFEFTSKYNGYDYISTNEGIYITNQEEISLLDYKTMVISDFIVSTEKYTKANHLCYYTMAICEKENEGTLKQYLVGYSPNASYFVKPYYATNSALYQIRCFDTGNKLIKTVLKNITKAMKVKELTPPIIEDYEVSIVPDMKMPVAANFKNGLQSLDLIYSKIVIEKMLIIKNVSIEGSLLCSDSRIFNVGDSYNILPTDIRGYALKSKANDSGTITKTSNTDVIFTYESLKIIPTTSIDGAYINIRCVDTNGGVLINRYNVSCKGDRTSIEPPIIKGYTNLYCPKDTYCTDDINTIVCVYSKVSPTTKVVYKCDELVIFEDIVLNVNGDILLSPPSYISVGSTTQYTNQSTFNIQCTITVPITLLHLVDKECSTIHNIVIEKKIDALDRQLLLINALPTYTAHKAKPNIDIFELGFVIEKTKAYVYHIYNGGVMKAESFTIPIYESVEIDVVQPEKYTTNSMTKYVTYIYDKYLFLNYVDRIYKYNFKTINLLDDSILKQDDFGKTYDQSLTYNYSDISGYTLVASTTDKNRIYLNSDVNHTFHVVPSNYKPTCNVSAVNGEVLVRNNAPVRFGYPILYKVDKVSKALSALISKDKTIYYIYDQIDGLDDNVMTALIGCKFQLIQNSLFNISDIPENSIVVDGHSIKNKKYLNLQSTGLDKVLYMPLDIKYQSLTSVIQSVIDCSNSCVDKSIRSSKIDITPTVYDKKYSKNSGTASVYVKATHAIVKDESYTVTTLFPQYDVRFNSGVNTTINTVGTFNKSIYTFNQSFNAEPSNESEKGTDVIKFKKYKNQIVVDEMLHFYMKDEFSNITNTAHESIYIEIGTNAVAPTLFVNKHNFKVVKNNHIYKGVKESSKFYNFYKQYWSNLEYVNVQVGILNNCINFTKSDKLNTIRKVF